MADERNAIQKYFQSFFEKTKPGKDAKKIKDALKGARKPKKKKK